MGQEVAWTIDVSPSRQKTSTNDDQAEHLVDVEPEVQAPIPKSNPNRKPDLKYQRFAKNIPIKTIQDKKLKGNLRKAEKKAVEAAERAAQSELLLTEESG
jgi:hypothetical protein